MYKLGKLPKRIDKRTLQLKKFLVKKNLPPLPITCDVDSSYPFLVNNHMYANDRYGDCVIAGRAHQTLRFEAFEENKQIEITDQEVMDEYFSETGGFDTGLDMLTSLNLWRRNGWTAASKHYDVHVYAEIDKLAHDELKYSVLLFNGAYTGFLVPQSAIDQFERGQTWTVVSGSPVVGGHCVYIKGYNEIGPVCVTWGKNQQMTWEFWDIYFDEAYAVIDNINEWCDPATDPLDVALLEQQLSEVTTSPPNPEPSPSPCKFGRGVARVLNVFLWMFKRKGRLYYMDPPKKKQNEKKQ